MALFVHVCIHLFRKYFTSKNKHIYQLINPTHTEFIYSIGKFLQNNSTGNKISIKFQLNDWFKRDFKNAPVLTTSFSLVNTAYLLSQTFPLNSQYKVFANKLLISNGIYFMYRRYDYKIYLLNMNFSRLCASVY